MQDEQGRMLCIECNPRLHSCVVLLRNAAAEAGEAMGRALSADVSSDDSVLVTPAEQKHVYWLYNELGKLAHVSTVREVVEVARTVLCGEDAVWDTHDPLPLLLLGHLQLPSLLWQQIRSGQQWTILNFCLGQLR